jgi:hypothetical protein
METSKILSLVVRARLLQLHAMPQPHLQMAVQMPFLWRLFVKANISRGFSRIEGGLCRQLFPQKLILLADVGRDLNGGLDVKIAALGRTGGQPFAPHT